jgi:hypothetical protein
LNFTAIEGNQEEINAQIASLDPNNILDGQTATLLRFRVYLNTSYTCMNSCEACWGLGSGTCGFWETNAWLYTHVQPTESSSSNINCVTYTHSQNLDGKLCFGFYDSLFFSECFVEYNGVNCTSCQEYFNNATGYSDCIKADCTNIDADALIDSCLDTGFVGPFEFLRVVQSNYLINNPFAVGNCTSPTTPSSTPLKPTEAPVIPTDAPDADTRGPIAPFVQTEAPVMPSNAPIAGATPPITSSEMDIPTVAAPTSAITTQSAPVSSTNRTSTTIGFVIGIFAGGMLLMGSIWLFVHVRRRRNNAAGLRPNVPKLSDEMSSSIVNEMDSNDSVVPSVSAALVPVTEGESHQVSYKDQCRHSVKPAAPTRRAAASAPPAPVVRASENGAADRGGERIPFAMAAAVTPPPPSDPPSAFT